MKIPESEIAGWGKDALPALYWNGIVRLPWVLPQDEVRAFRAHLVRSPMYKGHVKAQGDGIPRSYMEAQSIETVSHDMADVVEAPGLFDVAVQFTDFVAKYLMTVPKMYSCNAFWTRPGSSGLDPNIQNWHRDRDDTKFVALFMYGTDVEILSDGPHVFARGTHRNNDGQHRVPHKDEAVENIYGPAGTLFFADTSGLHFGHKPIMGERLLAWARWCVSDKPQSYSWDKLSPVKLNREPPNERVRQSTKLVAEWL